MTEFADSFLGIASGVPEFLGFFLGVILLLSTGLFMLSAIAGAAWLVWRAAVWVFRRTMRETE